jgi:hypothetical protein
MIDNGPSLGVFVLLDHPRFFQHGEDGARNVAFVPHVSRVDAKCLSNLDVGHSFGRPILEGLPDGGFEIADGSLVFPQSISTASKLFRFRVASIHSCKLPQCRRHKRTLEDFSTAGRWRSPSVEMTSPLRSGLILN